MATLIGLIERLERTFAPVEKRLKLYEKITEAVAWQAKTNPEMLEQFILFDFLRPRELLEKLISPTSFRSVQFLEELESNNKETEKIGMLSPNG